ncbi:MAG: FtsX-like permease family protein [Omnitrophica WOR_2 bacterium]
MNILLSIWAVFSITARRLAAQKILALASLSALVISVALVMSVPLYADAIYYRVFKESINKDATKDTGAIPRPPFALMFRYVGSFNGSKEWEDVRPVDSYFTGAARNAFGLPVQLLARFFSTDTFSLFPTQDLAYHGIKKPLTYFRFGFIGDLSDHITLLEGSFPQPAGNSANSTIEVLVSEPLATELGVQVGETYASLEEQDIESKGPAAQFPVRIAGIWKPKDISDPFWFYQFASLTDRFLVPEATFRDRISPYMSNEVYLGIWYYVLDGSNFRISDTQAFLRNLMNIHMESISLLDNMRLDISPVEALVTYERESRLLTIFLYALSIPFLALILAFISLISGLSTQVRRNEIAMYRSRGTTVFQLVGMAILESLLLGAFALAIGAPAGMFIARFFGQTQSFLKIGSLPDLRVEMVPSAIALGLVVVAVSLVFQVIPTLSASLHTVVTYKQERARELRRPWWQRAYLDILILIPAGYGAYQLRLQGSLIRSFSLGGNPFENPLLFLVPVLAIFAVALLLLRIMPIVMAGIAWLAARTNSVGLLLAARHLSRSPGFYTTPLFMLILTLSLSIFTASMAGTLDQHLYDRMYYQNGADLKLFEFGESKITLFSAGAPAQKGSQPAAEEEGPRWFFLPVTEHLRVPAVEHATRLGDFTATANSSRGNTSGVFYGIDRIDFPLVAYWRRDFATNNLGVLMNELGLVQNGVLVSCNYLGLNGLNRGDTLQLNVSVYDVQAKLNLKILDCFKLFPTWYPADGPLFVGNLDYLYREIGGQYPYRVWLKTTPNSNTQAVLAGLAKLGLDSAYTTDARQNILDEQIRPNRQGLFGNLTVGFLSAVLLTVLSFLLYAIFSFRRRFIEFGVLQAIGLSARQMTVFLGSELAFLIVVGTGIGTLLGIAISRLFIPYLQLGASAADLIPPYQVIIAWPAILRIYGLVGILFAAALLILVALLLRMKIFQAIKLGETV